MMPAHGRHDRPGRSPAPPSLPPVNDEATIPFSDLFRSGFDPATVDATTQLADRSISVTSNGRRYRIESLPDESPVYGRVPTSPPVPAAAAQPASFYTPSPTISGSPAPAYPVYPAYPVPPSQFQVHASDPGPGWSRSSNVSSPSSSPSAYSAQSGYARGVVPGPEPRGLAHQVTNMVSRLNITRFDATPMYGMSDGGVQAAEILTDPDLAPRPPTSPTNPTRLSPRVSYFDQEQHQQPSPPPHPQAPSWGPYDSPGAAPQYWSNTNYANYTVQTNQHLQDAQQRAVATTGLPSLLEGATAMTLPHRASDPAFSTDKEVWKWPTSGNPYYYPPLHASVSAPSSYVNRGPPSGEFHTLTPVTVVPHHTPSFSSDGASTGRDNVLPGEDLLFDGPVKSSESLTYPVFKAGVLKVFRSALTNDLRLHCKVDRESETYCIKASNAQLVPVYAFDRRLSNVVCIRNVESNKGTGYSQGNSRLSGIYQFSSLIELFDFQAKLTGEKVVLDIGSVRMVTLSKANSRSSTQFSSARLQMWQELEGHRRNAQYDFASFVTARTTRSGGSFRERVVVSPSKLMLYLGRSGEYITVFITDDIEIKPEGRTLVKLKLRKGATPFSWKASRWQHWKASRWQHLKARLQPSHGSEPAGLDIHGRAVEADVGSDYDSYKTFEIEFENSPSQDIFVRKWDEVVKERRAQRARLTHIQEEMESSVFTGRQARDAFISAGQINSFRKWDEVVKERSPQRLAWDSTNSSPGESEQACSGDQKASGGDQPDDPPLPTRARRNSLDSAMDTPEENSSGESSIEIESLSVSGVSDDELIWAPDPDDGIAEFIDAAAHRLLGEYQRATIFPPPNEAVISTMSPATHGETPRVTINPEPSRHPPQYLPWPDRKGKRANKGQGQDSDDEESQRQQPKKQKVNAPTEGKPTLLLACPFWKLDSQTHDRCFKLILSNTSRVKQHLIRKHAPDFYCQRCHAIFPNQETLDQHIQVQVVTCPCCESGFPQITYQQRLQLSTKSKTNLPEADQWFAIWDIIFPGQLRPSSPYIDVKLSEDLCRFREFAEADGPDIMTAEMQHSLQMTEIPAEQTAAILRQVISRCITLLFERWPARRPPLPQLGDAAPSSATAMPSESPPAGSSGVQSSSNSIPAMHRETPTSSVVSIDRNAMMPGNTQQEEPFVAVPTCEVQDAEPSDGFQIQGEGIWQELCGWDQSQDMDLGSGMPSGIPDFEFDMAEIEEGSDTVKL